jgi:D-arabinose 1-dehydrogenase-like Zn-dependent alcohol dehydrogenase
MSAGTFGQGKRLQVAPSAPNASLTASSNRVCRVTAVTSNASKVDFIKALGADHVVVAQDLSNFHK